MDNFFVTEALTPEVIRDPDEFLMEQFRWNRKVMLNAMEGSEDRERAFYRMVHFGVQIGREREERDRLTKEEANR